MKLGGIEPLTSALFEDQVGLEPTMYNSRLKADADRRYGYWSIFNNKALALP